MNTWGTKVRLSIFGESHGEALGIVIDGLEAGTKLNLENINKFKDLYNFEWLPDYDNKIGSIPPAELSTAYIDKLWSMVMSASKESALIAAANIAYLEQRARIIKPFKYGIQIDTVI